MSNNLRIFFDSATFKTTVPCLPTVRQKTNNFGVIKLEKYPSNILVLEKYQLWFQLKIAMF